jgi:hypothetical protein
VQCTPTKKSSYLACLTVAALGLFAAGNALANPDASVRAQDDQPAVVESKPQAKPRTAKPQANPAGQTAAAVAAKPRAANAQAAATPASVSTGDVAATPTPQAKPAAGGSYYIEFRSRYAASYGHTYAVHGQVGSKKSEVVGLHPATESPIPWMIGHIIPVISETGPSDGDVGDTYVSARYRVLLTKAEYSKLLAFLSRLKASSPLWHAAMYNCNAFVADIAKYVGLESPSHFLYPQDFINGMRELNKGRQRVAAGAPIYTAQEH